MNRRTTNGEREQINEANSCRETRLDDMIEEVAGQRAFSQFLVECGTIYQELQSDVMQDPPQSPSRQQPSLPFRTVEKLGPNSTPSWQGLLNCSDECFPRGDSAGHGTKRPACLSSPKDGDEGTPSDGRNSNARTKPSSDDRIHSRTKSSNPNKAIRPTSPENQKLEEIPILHSGDEVPVAAVLVSQLEEVPVATVLVSQVEYLMHEMDETADEEQLSSQRREDLTKGVQVAFSQDPWVEKFQELQVFQECYGHCLVPQDYCDSPSLSRWVKRQRNKYRPYKEKLDRDASSAGVSGLMRERIEALDDLGFVWDCQAAAWEEKFLEIQEYRRTFHHCNVPTSYPPNQPLAVWVKCQRRQYKLYMKGQPSGMTKERIQELDSIQFTWELRKHHRRLTSQNDA